MAKNLEVTLLLDYYGELLTQKQRTITGYYYFDDLSLAEIAQNEGVTRQAVRDIIRRTEQQLSELESRLHFAHLISRVTDSLGQLRDMAENESGDFAQKVKADCAALIKDLLKE